VSCESCSLLFIGPPPPSHVPDVFWGIKDDAMTLEKPRPSSFSTIPLKAPPRKIDYVQLPLLSPLTSPTPYCSPLILQESVGKPPGDLPLSKS